MVKRVFILIIKAYQKLSFGRRPVCRFYPSCSYYSIEAMQKYGVIKGGWLSVKRISKCQPFHPGGYDPLP
jgi:putative membrane protein insertion efficiency factor